MQTPKKSDKNFQTLNNFDNVTQQIFSWYMGNIAQM